MNDLFVECDLDGDGVIDRKELRATLERLGKGRDVSDEEVDTLMSQLDTTDTGKINLNDFTSGFAPLLLSPSQNDTTVNGSNYFTPSSSPATHRQLDLEDQPPGDMPEEDSQLKEIFDSMANEGTVGVADVAKALYPHLQLPDLEAKVQQAAGTDQLDFPAFASVVQELAKEQRPRGSSFGGLSPIVPKSPPTSPSTSHPKHEILSYTPQLLGSRGRSLSISDSGEFPPSVSDFRRRVGEMLQATSLKSESLLQQCEALVNEKEALKRTTNSLKSEIEQLQGSNERLLDEIEELRRQAKDDKAKVKAGEKIRDTNRELLDNIEKLKEEMDSLRKEYSQAKKSNSKLVEERDSLTVQLDETQKSAEELNTRVKELETQSKSRKTSEDNGQDATQLREELEKTKKELRDLQQNSEEKLSMRDSQIESLSQENDVLKKQQQEEKTLLEASRTTIKLLKRSLEEHEATKAQEQREKNSAEPGASSVLSELEKEVERRLTPRIPTSASMESVEVPELRVPSRSVSFENVSSLEEQIRQLEQTNESLREQLALQPFSNASKEEEKAKLEKELQETISKLKDMRQNNLYLEEEKKVLEKENADLAQKVSETEDRIAVMKEQWTRPPGSRGSAEDEPLMGSHQAPKMTKKKWWQCYC